MKRPLRSAHLCISLFLLALIAVCLFSACAYNPSPNTAAAIPEGWEVVSESEGVTYLQLKEGSDAYYWINGTPHGNEVVRLELILPNDLEHEAIPLETESITVLFYYGYGYFEYDSENQRFVMIEKESENKDEPLRLVIDRDSDNFDVEICTLEGVLDQNNLIYEHSSDPLDSRIGLTRAALVTIPTSAFVYDNWEYVAIDLVTEGNRRVAGDTMNACKFDGYLHFSEESFNAQRSTFPYALWNAFIIILPLLNLAAIALMIVGAVKRSGWMYFAPWIPCMIGSVYSYAAMRHFGDLPTSDDPFGGLDYLGQVFILYVSIYSFIVLAVVLMIVRALIDYIRVHRKSKKSTNSDQATE